jgi:hypothetical protein
MELSVMKRDFNRALLLIFPLAAMLATTACASDVSSSVRRITATHISLNLPVQRYTALTEIAKAAETSLEGTPVIRDFALVRQRAVGGTPSDSGSVCLATVNACVRTGAPLNYWIDEVTSKIQLGDPTEPVGERKIGEWDAFEAFPLCGWTTSAGTPNPYGGQCYAVVLASASKTVSFQFLLGRNAGCKEFERCWKTQLATLRRMLASVE